MTPAVASWGCQETPRGEVQTPEPAVFPDSRQLSLTSSATDRQYQIQVALPHDYAQTSEEYPVVVVLDGNGQFGIAAETARNLNLEDEVPKLIVVAVGYPVGQFYHAIRPRALDLSTHRDTAWERIAAAEAPRLAGIETGNAAGFLQFLRVELLPWVDSTFRTAPGDRTLIGHSLGGLFVIYTLLEAPGTFRRHLSVSPSLWWACNPDPTRCWGEDPLEGAIMLQLAELANAGLDPTGHLYLVVGGDELPHMLSGPARLAERLRARSYSGLRWTLETLPGETHMSVVGGAISRGLRWLFSEEGT